MADIGKLDAVSEDEGVVVHFHDAEREPMYDGDEPFSARVAGSYSSYYRKERRRQQDKLLRLKRAKLDSEAVDQSQLELEVACIIEWTLSAGGKPLPISVATWGAVLKAQPQWQEQVQEAMNDHAAFFGSRSSS